METNTGKSHRKFRGMNGLVLTDAISDALLGRSPKEIARDINCTPRTAENWKLKKNAPNAVQMIRLMNAYATVRRAVMGFVEGPSEDRLERGHEEMWRHIRALEKQIESLR